MNISESVRQAIADGTIAQVTVDELGDSVVTAADTRALSILADAVSSNLVTVTEA